MKRFSLFLKLTITVVILYWITTKVNWSELNEYLVGTNLFWYTGGAIAVLLSYLLTGIRWHYLLKIQGIHFPMKRVQNLNFIGMFFNVFLLGSTGGDLTKLYYVNLYAPQQKTKVIVSMLMDRGIGLLMLIALALPFLPQEISTLLKTEDTRLYAIVLLVLFVSGVFGLALFLLFPVQKIPLRWREWAVSHPRLQLLIKLLESIRQHGRAARLTVLAFVISILSQLLNIVSAYMLALALGLSISFAQCTIMIAIVFTLISLPISIGGHGVRELSLMKLFAVFGVMVTSTGAVAGNEAAIAYSILLYSFQLLWGLVGGVVYMSSSHQPIPRSHENSIQ